MSVFGPRVRQPLSNTLPPLDQYSTILRMKRGSLTIPIILLLCCYANAQSEVDRGDVHDGVYSNSTFGFTFKYPKDWVVHGEATNERLTSAGHSFSATTTLPKPMG